MKIEKLLNWYHENKRDLPWRRTKNPYFIWISEIICQQTSVANAIPYYNRFVEKFPDVFSLAEASERDVLVLWQGLGYYSRARNLHQSAQIIVNQFQGEFPTQYQEILQLKGVGEYTAGAVASIAFDEKQPAVDGNVIRVLSRIFGMFESAVTASGKKAFKNKVMDLMKNTKPGDFNQALMEFGALQCTPQNPLCENCIFNLECYAFQNRAVADLPLKKKKISVKNRYFNYFVIEHTGGILLKKREENNIWKNLYEFPLFETDELIDISALQTLLQSKILKKIPFILSERLYYKKHKLSHQTIHADFYGIIIITDITKHAEKYGFLSISIPQFVQYPVSELIKTAFQTIFYEK